MCTEEWDRLRELEAENERQANNIGALYRQRRALEDAVAEAYECLTDAGTLGPDVTETAVEAARMVLAAQLAGASDEERNDA